jgi:hypothetical protein
MADVRAASNGRVWNWKPYIFLILILALFYFPFPNRHPQLDGAAYYVYAQAGWQEKIALPANHVLPQPFFLLMNSVHKLFGIQLNLASFFSLCDSLLMIVALLILFGFYQRLFEKLKPVFIAIMALGSCFAVWYFATDIENVALVMLGAALLLNVGWRPSHSDTIIRGILLGLLAVFATLCMQTLAVLSIFSAFYYLRMGKRKLAFSFLLCYLLVLGSIYSLIAFAYLGINTLEHFKNYLLGYAEISNAQRSGWMSISLMTPFAAAVGFSRAFLGLHPLMNLPWLKEMAVNGLPGNVLSNQIAIAEGITPWLQIPLMVFTVLLLISLPVFLWLAWKGSKRTKLDRDHGIDSRLLLVYAIIMALLTIVWLPQAGEFWLAVLIVLMPLAMRRLSAMNPGIWIGASIWVGLVAFTNLFGSIRPFADDTVDPTLPSILYLDEIRQPDDLYLIPYGTAYPQRWVFKWVIPVKTITPGPNQPDGIWENEFRHCTGTIYFSSDLFQLNSQKQLSVSDPAYNLAVSDWNDLSRSAIIAHKIGTLEIWAAKR